MAVGTFDARPYVLMCVRLHTISAIGCDYEVMSPFEFTALTDWVRAVSWTVAEGNGVWILDRIMNNIPFTNYKWLCQKVWVRISGYVIDSTAACSILVPRNCFWVAHLHDVRDTRSIQILKVFIDLILPTHFNVLCTVEARNTTHFPNLREIKAI